MNKRYYNCLLKQIKNEQPYYYLAYCVSIITTYILVIMFALYLVNSAYGDFLFKKNNNILCFNCNNYGLKYLLYLFLLIIIFYLINEIRFRIIGFKKIRKIKLRLGNRIIIVFSIIILLLLILLLL